MPLVTELEELYRKAYGKIG